MVRKNVRVEELRLAILVLAVATGFEGLVTAQGMCDDFSDGDIWNCKPFCWMDWMPGNAVYTPGDDCLEVNSTGILDGALLTTQSFSRDVSVHVRGSFNGTNPWPNPNGVYPHIHAVVHGGGNINVYKGGVSTQRTINIAKWANGGYGGGEWGTIDFDPCTEEGGEGYVDLDIELKATERPGPAVLLELWVWKHGTPRPADPQLSWTDGGAPHTSGLAGFAFWHHSGNPIQIDSVCIDPYPNDPDPFKRGDANADATIDIADGIFILSYLFAQGPSPSCEDAADANDDEIVDISDPTYILQNLFASGPPMPPPSPGCGMDPAGDALGCVRYEHCP